MLLCQKFRFLNQIFVFLNQNCDPCEKFWFLFKNVFWPKFRFLNKISVSKPTLRLKFQLLYKKCFFEKTAFETLIKPADQRRSVGLHGLLLDDLLLCRRANAIRCYLFIGGQNGTEQKRQTQINFLSALFFCFHKMAVNIMLAAFILVFTMAARNCGDGLVMFFVIIIVILKVKKIIFKSISKISFLLIGIGVVLKTLML